MRYKLMLLSLFALGVSMVASAQSTQEEYVLPKWNDNIFVGVGGGIQSVKSNGFSKIAPDFSVEVGKHITPIWGLRFVGTAGWQTLKNDDVKITNRNHAGLNLDVMLNLSTVFAGVNPDRKFEVYTFVGPQMNIHKARKAGTIIYDEYTGGEATIIPDTDSEKKVFTKLGASAGLGARYHLNNFWALFLESRMTVAPSIFSYSSEYRKAEGVGNLKLGVSYTLGGRKYRKPTQNIVEKEVIKEVVREVPKEVVVEKEVVKYINNSSPCPVFFEIGKANLTDRSKVTVKLLAEAMRENPDQKFVVAAYCDEATGSKNFNQKLSEKRLEVVTNLLVEEGVKKEQIIGEAHGGTKNMFGKNFLNRVVIMKAAK